MQRLTSLSLAALAVVGGPALRADDASEIHELRLEIQRLEQRLDALERKEHAGGDVPSQPGRTSGAAAASTTAGAPAPQPKLTVDDRGFRIASADGGTAIHFGGLIQFDSREFLGDGGGVLNNSFVLRRARVITDGTFDRIYSFQFVPDFAGSATTIFDAAVGISLSDAVQLRFGKFKSPVGLEQLQQDAYTLFDERSLATNLVPNRDLGAQIGGTLFGGVVTYQAGLFNGVADGANSTNQDFDNDKDADARVILQPFAAGGNPALSALGFGVAASVGREKGTSAVTAGYKTDGQQTFFKYNSTVVGDGEVWRVSPQAYWFSGPFGGLAEDVASVVNVRPTATGAKAQLRHHAWNLTASWVLTGENATFNGVVPNHPFNWRQNDWGAVQVAVRYAGVKIDPNAFPLFAAPTTNADEDEAWGLGVNWYLNRVVRISLDGYQDRFENPVTTSSTQILRQDEKSLISRVQLFF